MHLYACNVSNFDDCSIDDRWRWKGALTHDLDKWWLDRWWRSDCIDSQLDMRRYAFWMMILKEGQTDRLIRMRQVVLFTSSFLLSILLSLICFIYVCFLWRSRCVRACERQDRPSWCDSQMCVFVHVWLYVLWLIVCAYSVQLICMMIYSPCVTFQ